MDIFKKDNPFRGKNNPFNKDYVYQPVMKKKPPRKNKITRVEVINQRSGKSIADLVPGAVMAFAQSIADHKDADDIDFIGIDRNGYVYDTWTLSDVLTGNFVIQ